MAAIDLCWAAQKFPLRSPSLDSSTAAEKLDRAYAWLNRELEWAGLMPVLFHRDLGLKGEFGKAMQAVRTNGGDLSPLVAVIVSAQRYALEFCAQLAQP